MVPWPAFFTLRFRPLIGEQLFAAPRDRRGYAVDRAFAELA